MTQVICSSLMAVAWCGIPCGYHHALARAHFRNVGFQFNCPFRRVTVANVPTLVSGLKDRTHGRAGPTERCLFAVLILRSRRHRQQGRGVSHIIP